jgi:serine/threonine-protein kinase
VQKHTLDLRHLIRRCTECGRRYSPDAVFCPFDGSKLEDATRPDDNKLDPLVGQTVDARYAIENVIGEGGMGTVYRAKHVALGRALALKVLKTDLAKEADLAARFLQEAQATAAIKHPNIVSITDFGRLPDERPYFVMELLSGRTLAALIKAGGALPPRDAARIASAIADGLEAAHAAGVVHRDMKPENVFLLGEGASEVRVVDFGAAMMIGATRLTKAGVVFGTPHYMSPEQAAGRTVDHRADVYALGIMLYEMITGRVPFEGDTYMGVLTQHMFVAPRPPTEIVPELDGKLGALEGVVLHALEKEPADRFATMREFGDAIGAAFGARGATPSWPAPSSRRTPLPRGIADDLELPTMGEIRERISAHDGLERRSRARTWVTVIVAVAFVVLCAGVGVRVYSATEPVASSATPTASSSPPVIAPIATETVTPSATVAITPPPPLLSSPSPPPPLPPPMKSAHSPHPSSTHAPPPHDLGTLGPDPFAGRQ